ncbi:MAG: class I SAM-dependent methyltransferase [Alphaproteobacteria bacterium]|nr:class I SAM-dependent methyltransferase [Alphaproteobacteria bacterium]
MVKSHVMTKPDLNALPAPLLKQTLPAQTLPADRRDIVQQVFASVASRYDLMNDVMSLGLHRVWKQDFIAAMAPCSEIAGRTLTYLDVAGGTGDITALILRQAPRARVLSLDISAEMIAHGRDRAINEGNFGRITHIQGDAEALPLPAQSVENYSIAFGLRNVSDRPRALSEAYRVLKPGGRFFCLEFSPEVTRPLAPIYRLWSEALPHFGAFLAQDRESYRYLVTSIREFLPPGILANYLAEAGFERIRTRALSGGIAYIHQAMRL